MACSDSLNSLPPEFTDYVWNLYSSLLAHVSTKDWRSYSFNIIRGVFQGDTLSPLVAFNPILLSIAAHHSNGFFPQENVSDEEPGWYLERNVFVNGNGGDVLRYRKGGLLEVTYQGSKGLGLLLKEVENRF